MFNYFLPSIIPTRFDLKEIVFQSYMRIIDQAYFKPMDHFVKEFACQIVILYSGRVYQ